MSGSENEPSALERIQSELKALKSEYNALFVHATPDDEGAKAAQRKLEQAGRDGVRKPDRELLSGLVLRLKAVQASYQACSDTLPSHDQRVLSQELSSLEASFAAATSAARPRTKFVFKKKSSSQNSASLSAPDQSGLDPKHTEDVKQSDGLAVPSFPDLTPRPIRRPVFSGLISIHNQSGEHIRPAQAPGAMTITHLRGCVALLPRCDAASISHASQSLVLLCAVQGAAHLTSITDGVVVVCARQFRLHRARNVTVYLSCGSEPVLEDCADVRFASLPSALGWEAVENDRWAQVQDFSFPGEGASPHWRLLEDGEAPGEEVWRGLRDESLDTARALAAFGLEAE